MFSPVVNSGGDGRWLTMIKADREPTDEEFKDAVEELVLEHGIDLIDSQKRNFGVVNGETVLIDYGAGTNMIDDIPAFDSREDAWESIKENLVFN